MNLLKKPKKNISNYEEGFLCIEDFRLYQYQLIEYFIEIMIRYVSSKNNNFLTFDKITKNEVFTYNGIRQSELDLYTVDIINNVTNENKTYFKFYMPRLIENNFYLLNGHIYVPLLYLLDKPVSIKEKSVILTSLFSSITMYIKNKIAIFSGHNIPLEIFVGLFLYNDNSPNANKIRNAFSFNVISEKDIINYFNTTLSIKSTTIKEIIEYIENFFFDEYTKYLYQSCYFEEENTLDFGLKEIIEFSLIRFIDKKNFSFINLNNKRLMFIELLLSPLFQKITTAAIQAKKGFKNDVLSINPLAIIKNFQKSQDSKKSGIKKDVGGFHGLSGKMSYDIVNLYSSIMIHKCSFIKPGMSQPPSTVNDIHKTYFEKICPITVSSIDVGETVSIIPETYVDIFGQFLNLEKGDD